MLLVLMNLYIQTHISSYLQASIIPPKSQLKNLLIFESIGFVKLSIPFLHWNRSSPKTAEVFTIWTYHHVQGRFTSYLLT